MQGILDNLATRYQIPVTPAGIGWNLQLPSRGDFVCALDVGPEALEWYASVLHQADGHKVWTDWMDYRNYDDGSEQQLLDDKRRDLAWFLEAWFTATAIRVARLPRLWGLAHSTRVEWNHAGTWQPLQMHDPHR